MVKSKETIKHKEKILAHIFRNSLESKGTSFLTPSNYTLQLGLLTHPKGAVLKEHIHNPRVKYNVDTTQEFLYVEKGSVQITFYSDKWERVARRVLNKGDFLLHVSGGHGFKMLKKSRMIEIKQGPFPGDKEAKIYR